MAPDVARVPVGGELGVGKAQLADGIALAVVLNGEAHGDEACDSLHGDASPLEHGDTKEAGHAEAVGVALAKALGVHGGVPIDGVKEAALQEPVGVALDEALGVRVGVAIEGAEEARGGERDLEDKLDAGDDEHGLAQGAASGHLDGEGADGHAMEGASRGEDEQAGRVAAGEAHGVGDDGGSA
eukprot:9364467-Alexandrium_andersonii.AAC.1